MQDAATPAPARSTSIPNALFPIRRRIQFHLGGAATTIAVTIQIDRDLARPRNPGEWTTFRVGPLVVRVKLEA